MSMCLNRFGSPYNVRFWLNNFNCKMAGSTVSVHTSLVQEFKDQKEMRNS